MKRWPSIIEGVSFIIITVILYSINLYIPLLNYFAMLILPLPIIKWGIRYNLRYSIIAVTAVVFILIIIFDFQIGLKYLCFDGLLSIFWIMAIKSKLNSVKILFIGIIEQILGLILIFTISILNGINIIGLIKQWLSFFKSNAINFSKQFMLNYSIIDVNEKILNKIQHSIDYIIIILPSLIFVINIIQIFLIYKILIIFLRKNSNEISDLPLIKYWDISKSTIHLFLWSLALIYIGNTKNFIWIYTIGNNLCIIISFILLIQGVAVFRFFTEKYSLLTGIRGMILIILIIYYLPVVITMVGVLGLCDAIFNYRHLKR